MGLAIKRGAAKVLAVLFLNVFIQIAQAHELTLPLRSTDPVVLAVPQGDPDEGMLKVFVQGAETPIAGSYTVAGENLFFKPAFGFEPRQDYTAHVAGTGSEEQVTFRIAGERNDVSAAVTAIHPSGDTLPENTLRFYIHFSVPMQPQVAFDYIKLVDASGTVDEAAFMRFKQELWNEDRTRLTVLIDPGRIKREVATNVELGPALREGQRYTLTVAGGWPSADGATVLQSFSKAFHVAAPLRTLPKPDHWIANAPCVDTRDPFTLTFDRPFDRHLLPQDLWIETGAGVEIVGTVAVSEAEHSWRFIPNAPWRDNDPRLVVDPRLEDVAGNNFHDLLDHVAGPEENETAISGIPIQMRNCTD